MHVYPHELSERYSIDDLDSQFVLSRKEDYLPDHWVHVSLGDFFLASHPSLPCTEIKDKENHVIGYCFGHYITECGTLFGILRLPHHQKFDESIEHLLQGLSGRFFLFIEVDGEPRI